MVRSTLAVEGQDLMTEQEQYLIIGKVVSDHEKAKKQLTVLLAEAKELGEGLTAVTNVLRQNADCRVDGDGDALQIKNRNSGLSTTVTWPTGDELRQLILDIDTTRTAITSLEAQRKELGV